MSIVKLALRNMNKAYEPTRQRAEETKVTKWRGSRDLHMARIPFIYRRGGLWEATYVDAKNDYCVGRHSTPHEAIETRNRFLKMLSEGVPLTEALALFRPRGR